MTLSINHFNFYFYFNELGPLVTMMGKMVKNMIYFVVLLLVVLLSFGVSKQAILYPHKEASWSLIKDVRYGCYFYLVRGIYQFIV